jgi:peptidylprolyl isomerase
VKKVGLISVILVLFSLVACGSGSNDPETRTDVVVWRKGEPTAIIHRGLLPKKLIVKDLHVGSGAVLEKNDFATLKYKSFDYRTGQRYEDWWTVPFHTGFGKGESLAAWESGLKGMRVGGRRVLIVPAKEAYGHVPVFYILELVSARRLS